MSGLCSQADSEFVTKRTEQTRSRIEIHLSHPTPFGVTDSVKDRIDRDAARISADNPRTDQPWQIQNRASCQHDCRTPSARPKEKRCENRGGKKDPESEGVSQRKQTEHGASAGEPLHRRFN